MPSPYYISCEIPPEVTNRFSRCRDEFGLGEVYTLEELQTSLTPPSITFEQANFFGGLIFIIWFIVWKGKRFANLGDPSRSD